MSNSTAACAGCAARSWREAATLGDANTGPEAAAAWRLLLVGLAGGAFSGLLGVGGGAVIVPLLMALAFMDARRATATSLAAIAIIAVWSAASYAALGNVAWGLALVVGIPAVAGSIIGVRIRARVSTQAIARAFAVLLVVSAIALVVVG